MSLFGLICAAGNSSRMGSPKALIDTANGLILHDWCKTLRQAGAAQIWVSAPPKPWQAELCSALQSCDFECIENLHPQRAMLGSVQSLIPKIAPHASVLLICPVDNLGFNAELCKHLAHAVHQGALAAVPVYDKQRGHPVAISSMLFDPIMRLSDDDSLRTILEQHARVTEVVCEVPGVLANLNTPEDVARYLNPSAKIGSAAATEAPGLKPV